jgi:hypothetical protein
MKRFSNLLLCSVFVLTGCGPGGLFLPNIKDYTPEQLESFKDLGYDAVRCANVKGPPPSGNVSTVTIPKGRNAKVVFTGCDVHSIEITGGVGAAIGAEAAKASVR